MTQLYAWCVWPLTKTSTSSSMRLTMSTIGAGDAGALVERARRHAALVDQHDDRLHALALQLGDGALTVSASSRNS